jgi:hypothetical protein
MVGFAALLLPLSDGLFGLFEPHAASASVAAARATKMPGRFSFTAVPSGLRPTSPEVIGCEAWS